VFCIHILQSPLTPRYFIFILFFFFFSHSSLQQQQPLLLHLQPHPSPTIVNLPTSFLPSINLLCHCGITRCLYIATSGCEQRERERQREKKQTNKRDRESSTRIITICLPVLSGCLQTYKRGAAPNVHPRITTALPRLPRHPPPTNSTSTITYLQHTDTSISPWTLQGNSPLPIAISTASTSLCPLHR
jgi:hypothetical protein